MVLNGSISASYAPRRKWYGFVSAGGQLGLGVEGSPVTVVNIQGTYQYTPVVKPIFQFGE